MENMKKKPLFNKKKSIFILLWVVDNKCNRRQNDWLSVFRRLNECLADEFVSVERLENRNCESVSERCLWNNAENDLIELLQVVVRRCRHIDAEVLYCARLERQIADVERNDRVVRRCVERRLDAHRIHLRLAQTRRRLHNRRDERARSDRREERNRLRLQDVVVLQPDSDCVDGRRSLEQLVEPLVALIDVEPLNGPLLRHCVLF